LKRRPDIDALIQKHRQLDKTITASRGQFLSDWNCDNPLVEHLLGPELSNLIRRSGAADSYIYFDEEGALLDAICAFHAGADGLRLSPSNIVAGPGSSSFLAAFAVWLRRSGYTDVYCLPPLYHTLYLLLESLDITVTPVSTHHAYEEQFSIKLPDRHTVLLMCDPVWYAGKCVPEETIGKIAEWQRATKSLVFVDGSFQYMKWSGEIAEHTSDLAEELTFRLVCPAKTLAVPLFRFAYLIHPTTTHDDLTFLYESMIGGSSAADLAFAHRALDVMRSDTLSRVMPQCFSGIYRALAERQLIRTRVIPECGYFIFAVPLAYPAELVMMDQSYFEVVGYPEYGRINLMAARRIYGLAQPTTLLR